MLFKEFMLTFLILTQQVQDAANGSKMDGVSGGHWVAEEDEAEGSRRFDPQAPDS